MRGWMDGGVGVWVMGVCCVCGYVCMCELWMCVGMSVGVCVYV